MLGRRYYRRWSLVILLFPLTLFLYLTRPDQPGLFLTRLNQMSVEVERRLTWWDWKDTEEEVNCRNLGRTREIENTKDPIPYVVHYVLLGPDGQPAEMNFLTFLSIKATILRMKPKEIKIHTYGLNISNPWWKSIEKYVTVVEYDPGNLRAPHGKPIDDFRIPHQSDFIRLDVLQREGGIYMDTDVFVLKSFEDLLDSPRDIVMGHEGGNRYGLCNAIIIARAKSEFLQKWIKSYSNFQAWIWNYHSVRMPKLLQVQYPELICPLSPTVFFWPTWSTKHAQYMQTTINRKAVEELQHNMSAFGGSMYENQLALHRADKNLTAERILKEDTRFNILMRDVANAHLP